MTALYGRDELISLVESQVGLAFGADRRLRRAGRQHPPIIVVTGGRGMGKTAFLQEIAAAYGNRVPRSRCLDLADSRYSAAPETAETAGRDPGREPLPRILRDLKWDLELRVPNGGGLSFPRLSLGLLAIAVWQPGEEISLQRAKSTLIRAGKLFEPESGAQDAGSAGRGDVIADWIAEVTAKLAAGATASAVPVFPVSMLLEVSVQIFVKKMLKKSLRDASLEWHRKYDPNEPGDRIEALLALADNFHKGGDDQAFAERCLVAAFLADVSAGYGRLARQSRAGRPVALLDNVGGCAAGDRFLDFVARNREQREPDPLVIVATRGPWQPPAPRAQPWLVHDLSPLDHEHVWFMLARADRQLRPPDLGRLIHRLTAGLPLGAEVLTRAVTERIPAAGRSPARLLPLEAAGLLDLTVTNRATGQGEHAAARILRQLIPDGEWRDLFITLAPACDQAEAATISSPGRAEKAREILAGNGWRTGPRHFVGDLFLRTLLLHQLAQRQGRPGSAQVHGLVSGAGRAPAAPAAARPGPAQLYHRLALGHAGEVAGWLRGMFGDLSAETWLGALRQIACAPAGGLRSQIPDRRKAALGGTYAETGDEVSQSIYRLLHAAWYLTDPLVAPDEEVISQLSAELNFLARKHPGDSQVLFRASHDWPARLRAWQPQSCDEPLGGE